jgi:hypothetical protein
MGVGYIQIGHLKVSRLILGSNPFSGYSHQTAKMDDEMKHYYSVARVKAVIKQAEELGVNTQCARVDNHISRLFMEYWDEGGKIQWIAQTTPERGDMRGAADAIARGAAGCYIHGGTMDHAYANKKLDVVPPVIEKIKETGLIAGVASHNPEVIEWADRNLDVDFYMCCYYNSANRDKRAELASGMPEWFHPKDRDRMTATIQSLSKPALHYKVLAAARNDPKDAFAYVARRLRPQDAVVVGIYNRRKPDMLKEDVELLEACLKAEGKL